MSQAQADPERTAAAGWLQLGQDQRLHREALAPIGLAPRRALDARERDERLELRALQQQDLRDDRRRARAAERAGVPRAALPGRSSPAQVRRRDALRFDQQQQRRWPQFERR